MTLEFPNASRHFDGKHGRVEFWGYDGALEITFFVDAEVLMTLDPRASCTECSLLETFDGTRDRIQAAAGKLYTRSRRRIYCHNLAAKDF